MRIFLLLFITTLFLAGCDDNRVFEQITDLDKRQWLVSEKPEFEFVIDNRERNTIFIVTSVIPFPTLIPVSFSLIIYKTQPV